MWGLHYGFGDQLGAMSTGVVSAIIAGLCALAAAIASLSFFAGVDESADYVFRETQVDKLTGLNARIAMIGKIAEAASSTLRTARPVFLIDIDIDRIKQLNEAIGYQQGDALIREFARRLAKKLPDGLDLGRIGAGEFAILVPDRRIGVPIDQLVEDLLEEMSKPVPAADAHAVGEPVGGHRLHAQGRARPDPAAAARQSGAAERAHRRRQQLGRPSTTTWAASPTTGSGSNPNCTPPSRAAISSSTTSRRWTSRRDGSSATRR